MRVEIEIQNTNEILAPLYCHFKTKININSLRKIALIDKMNPYVFRTNKTPSYKHPFISLSVQNKLILIHPNVKIQEKILPSYRPIKSASHEKQIRRLIFIEVICLCWKSAGKSRDEKPGKWKVGNEFDPDDMLAAIYHCHEKKNLGKKRESSARLWVEQFGCGEELLLLMELFGTLSTNFKLDCLVSVEM